MTMPDLKLPRGLELALGAASAVLVALGIFLILMTFPAFGTRATNWALGVWGPDGASVSRAHTRFPGLNTLVFRDFRAPEQAEISTGSIRFNFFGILPGISWISKADLERGYVALTPSDPDEGGGVSLRGLRTLIDDVAIRDIELRYTRRDEMKTVQLSDASGSLRSGAIRLNASGGGSVLQFEGDSDASTLATLSGRLRLTGDNFADFAWLAGFASPDTPPYDAVAHIALAGNRWTFDFQPETRIGDSDMYGPLVIEFGEGVPVIDAKLRSSNLDFDDLGIVFGVPIGVGEGETVSEEQTSARRLLDESSRLIPNAVIDFTRLDAVDGTVTLEADEVSDAIFAIQGLKLEIEIAGRVVRAPVVQMDFAQGRLNAYLTIDGSQSPAVTTAEGKLTDVPFANLALDPYLRGTASGEFKLDSRGDGFREAAASLNGRLSVWSEDADLLAIVAEGAALDIGEMLFVLNERAGEETYTEGRCAVASVDFAKGVGQLNPAVVDTDDSLVLIEGQIGMAQETLDLSVKSEAKDASFGTLIGDIRITGTFRSPGISAFNAEGALQFSLAAVLGSITGGLAALPFLEIGDAPDAPCADLLAQAETTRQ
jgi:uncharacterized protein involved in outer membrane biogenesis